ncbi:hypothetical protein HAX54_029024, partial [Datura stramonium]|nr:hypothetical protein [Datura stramonium]
GAILPRVKFKSDSSEGVRHVCGMELRLHDTLHSTLRIIIWHPSSSEAPRQGHGTELMLCDTLRATLPVYSDEWLIHLWLRLRMIAVVCN